MNAPLTAMEQYMRINLLSDGQKQPTKHLRRTASTISNATFAPIPQEIQTMRSAAAFSPKEILAWLNVKLSATEDATTFLKLRD